MDDYKNYNDKEIINNIEKLKSLKNLIKELYPDEDPFILESMCTESLNFLIDTDHIEEHPFKTVSKNFIECYRDDIKVIKSNKIYLEPISDFLVNGYSYFVTDPLYDEYSEGIKAKDIKLTNDELLTLVFDFYQTIPSQEIRDYFNKHFANRKDSVRFKGNATNTMFLPFINYPYINISEQTSKAKQSTNIVHEYGHVISTEMYPRFESYESTYPFIELMPITFELLASQYFKKIFNKTEIYRKEELDYLFTQLLFAETITMEKITKEKKIPQKKVKSYITEKFGADEAEYITEYPALQSFTYLIPYITALEIIDIYKDDPELALENLKSLNNMENNNYLEHIEELGMTLNTHTKDYIKTLKKQS